MGSICGDESPQWDTGSNANDEKIFVAVRLRPLNNKEAARQEASEWECINHNTIMHKNGLQEKSMFPAAYTFDRVFSPECPTKQVYEEGPKKIAFSVVNGINSSIFAYGQTSSGKTYTMCGITEYTMADIYDYIKSQRDREFVLKVSAMEIYNESVRDLLGSDSTQLRLLDDPERGTVVEKLTEVALRDWSHLMELLAVCKAERQTGETSLNEMSSRSHQIIRLTVESSPRGFIGAEDSSTLTATMNFVDLAGSERASQTSSTGSRLKEGSHINRSLLTLGTVIRKLSKGKNGHVPYRDSKLTRILQNSLGGNARTAIICTMSPAHSHVEQSRNTLLFAMCAKKISTNAQVNVVKSEKALVKKLQRELARLEKELKTLASISGAGDSASLLIEKERLIQKMDSEIRDLTHQRDLAQSRVQEILRSTSNNQLSRMWVEADQLSDTHDTTSCQYESSISDSSEVVDHPHLDVASNISRFSDKSHGHNSTRHDPQLPDNSEEHFLSDGSSPSESMNKYFGPDLSLGWEEITHKNYESSEDNCKEVRCIEIEPCNDKSIKASVASSPHKGDGALRHAHSDVTCEALNQKIQDFQTIIHDGYVSPYHVEQIPVAHVSVSRMINLLESRSCGAAVMTAPSPPLSENALNAAENAVTDEADTNFTSKAYDSNCGANCDTTMKKDPQDGSDFVDEKAQNITMAADKDSTDAKGDGGDLEQECEVGLADNTVSTEATGDGGDLEQVCEVGLADNTVQDPEPKQDNLMKMGKSGDDLHRMHAPQNISSNWSLEFERQRKEIIQLWDSCHIPLVHRSYFFLLFKGDQSDSVYMEVEFRRLSFLLQTISPRTSSTALDRERGMLSRQLLKKFSTKEREALYQKWGIDLNSKRRRHQLCHKLWKDTENMEHIKESAALVAKLVGEPGQAPKEIFGLTFVPQHRTVRSFSWKHSMPSIRRGCSAPY